MRFTRSNNQYFSRIIRLRLSARQEAQCDLLRAEAGRCWSEMVKIHTELPEDQWPGLYGLERIMKRQYALHSQSVQALAQKFDANLKTARTMQEKERREGGIVRANFPHRRPSYQIVIWIYQSFRIQEEKIVLSNGRYREPLTLKLPKEYLNSDIRRVELVHRVSHYEMVLVIREEDSTPEINYSDNVAGIDLGEINIAAVVTENGHAIVLSGRYLRSIKRLRNKRHSALGKRLNRCIKGSRRHRRLLRSRQQASSRFVRQQRDFLHKASKQVIDFSEEQQVTHLAIGDVRNVRQRICYDKVSNQKVSQWPSGQFTKYLRYKAARRGIHSETISESYSSRTCSRCGHRNSKQNTRVFTCRKCSRSTNRDANGAANICSRRLHGKYGGVSVRRLKYLRPVS